MEHGFKGLQITKGINRRRIKRKSMKISTLLTIFCIALICLGNLRASSSTNKKDNIANPSKTGPKGKGGDEDSTEDGDEDSESNTKIVKKTKAAAGANSASSSISLGFAFVAILAAVSML